MADNRINREQNTREKETRKKAWQRPEILPSLILSRDMSITGCVYPRKDWLTPRMSPQNYAKVGSQLKQKIIRKLQWLLSRMRNSKTML